MGEPAKQIPVGTQISLNQDSSTTRDKVERTYTSELVIAICSPIGTSKKQVIDGIESILKNKYHYDVEIITLSSYILKYIDDLPDIEKGKTVAYTSLMNKIRGGNEMRKRYNSSVLAELAISDILLDRIEGPGMEAKKDEELESRRKCFIIDSLKNLEELRLLRSLYRDIFYQFSIFSPKQERHDNLRNLNLANEECNELINTDDYENNNEGQNVRDTFIDGDFFLRVSNQNIATLSDRIERFIHLIFESKIITPDPNEIAMYEAKSAAGNSACLSRQVGAAITNEKGEIISRGWNDVPKVGGNLYKEGDEEDKRCFEEGGFCRNDIEKNGLSENIFDAIFDIDELKNLVDSSESHDAIKANILRKIRKSTKIKDLIEFSRAVHAEMHAIIIGSQLAGNKMINGKLFCTTYPCHNCGRHIILAGIKEIYYIEPYVKSLCKKLHEDAITENEDDSTKVRILMYDGVAPRRYLDFFTMKTSRKENGTLKPIDFTTISPKTMISLQSLKVLETQALANLKEAGLISSD